jgi:phenylacetate-coenzyme A ligase PaaK-like adenylate-forming protein
MFIAPSQVKRVCEAFPGLVIQLVISRSGHRDNLTAKLDAQAAHFLGNEFQAQFEKNFQEICTVKLDRVEFLKPGSLSADTKLLVDERTWK